MQDRSPEDFYPETWGDVIPKFRAFVRFVLWQTRREFPGFRRKTTRKGTILVAQDNRQVFTGAFTLVATSRTEVRVGEGVVNGVMPRIEGRWLDGRDEDGELEPEGIPTLDVSEGPGDRLRSYVGILVKIDPETGTFDPGDEEALTIAHRPALHEAFSEGDAPDEEGVAFWPIGQLTWNTDGDRIERVRQWLYFNQVHRFVPAADGGRGRHRFRPAP